MSSAAHHLNIEIVSKRLLHPLYILAEVASHPQGRWSSTLVPATLDCFARLVRHPPGPNADGKPRPRAGKRSADQGHGARPTPGTGTGLVAFMSASGRAEGKGDGQTSAFSSFAQHFAEKWQRMPKGAQLRLHHAGATAWPKLAEDQPSDVSGGYWPIFPVRGKGVATD